MKVEDIIEGLQIIEKARPKNDNAGPGCSPYHFRAEHDEIFVGSLEWPMPIEDKNRLIELGWHSDEKIDGWRTGV